MSVQVTISIDRAIKLKMVAPIWEIWKMKALAKDISPATLDHIHVAWEKGDTSLLIDLAVWEALISKDVESALTAKEDDEL